MRVDDLYTKNTQEINIITEEPKHSPQAEALACFEPIQNKAVSMNSTEIDMQADGIFSRDKSISEIKEQAQVLKDNIEVICKKMDTGTAVSIDEEGTDVNEMKPEAVVTVVERIQIMLATYCPDYALTVDVSDEQIKKVTHSSVSSINDNTKFYLLKNELEPTIENVYKAGFAGEIQPDVKSVSDKEWEELKPQAEKIMKSAGIAADEKEFSRVRTMMETGIPITGDNLNKLKALDDVYDFSDEELLKERMAAAKLEGRDPLSTLITKEKYPWEKTVDAIKTINEANADTISKALDIANQEKRYLCIKDIRMAAESKSFEATDGKNYAVIKATRELTEIRLMMTIEAGRNLEKAGIDIDTRDLSKLVEDLKEAEAGLLPVREGERASAIDVYQVNHSLELFESLKAAPNAVIGSVINFEQEATVKNMLSHVPGVNAMLQKASFSYEALSTQVRTDLGDSLIKAISASTEDILSENGYENDEAGRRAVRILAYNGMEFSTGNIDKVKSIDYSVNQLFERLTPQKAYRMIQEGINLLDTDVTQLNEYLNKESIQSETGHYAEFLYKLDKEKEITAEDREKYIALYGMLKSFAKDDMKFAGYMADNNMQLTMGNMLTAYMSRRAEGIKFSADDATGFSEKSREARTTYIRNLLGGNLNKITPDILTKENIMDIPLENFARLLESERAQNDGGVYQNITQLSEAGEEILRMVCDNRIDATLNNLLAFKNFIRKPAQLFEDDSETAMRFEKAFEEDEDLSGLYEKLAEKTENIRNQSLYEAGEYLDFRAKAGMAENARMALQLSKRNNFFIPYQKEDGIGVINLKLVEAKENSGAFQIQINETDIGKITISGKVTETSVFAQVLLNNKEQKDALLSRTDEVRAMLFPEYENVRVNATVLEEHPNANSSDAKTDTQKIFKVAKYFIKAFAK